MPVHLATAGARAFTTDEWDRHFRAEANRPFDLATSPLLRVLLFSVASYSLQVTVHHIVVDAWSRSSRRQPRSVSTGPPATVGPTDSKAER